MRRGDRAAAAAVVLLAGALAAFADAPAEDAPGGASEFWARREQAYRQDPRGPFTAIGSHYLQYGEDVVLRLAADSLVADPAGDAPGVRILWEKAGFTVEPVAGPGRALTMNGGAMITEPVRLGTEPGDVVDVRIGRFLLSFGNQDVVAGRVVVYDPMRLMTFRGFRVYPPDARFRVEAHCAPADPDTLELSTTRGLTKRVVRAAVLTFELDGAACRLDGFRTPGAGDGALFVPFRDRTSGDATYGVGRYLDVTPRGDGTAVLDFNEATNPWCAYSPFYNCVLPPESNVLDVAVEAGEKTPAGH